MILRRVEIGSFAGLADFTVELGPALNVLVGPNEAGKSTLYQAILHCLLTPVSLSRPQFQSQLGRFLPVGGGDTLRCALTFEADPGQCRLSKSWGATRGAELQLPDGSRISDEQRVASAMEDLLPAAPGTLRSVLAASQAGLAATVEALRGEPETLRGLSDLLRRAVLATDGVSVPRFRERLREKLDALLDHWDLQRERPEGNKGLENRWKRKVGAVLESWYQAEELRLEREEVLARERELGERGRQLHSCREELQASEARFKELEPVARDARERRPLEAELRAARGALGAAQADYEQWTRCGVEAESLAGELSEQQATVAALQGELDQAEAVEAGRRLAERYARARQRQQELEQARQKLGLTSELSQAGLEEIRGAAAELSRAEAAAQAGRLSVDFEARRELTVSVQADAQAPAQRRVRPQQRLREQAAGRLVLEHPDWRIEIRAGGGEPGSPSAADAAERLRGLLAAQQLGSLQEAEERARAWERARSEASAAEKLLAQELGQESYQDLQERFGALPQAAREGSAGRAPAVVAQDLGRAKARLAQTREKAQAGQRALEGLGRRWASREAVLARAVELTTASRELEARLAGLAPLPDGFADAAEFLAQLEDAQRRLVELKEQRAGLEAECRALVRDLGEESSEEIATRLEEARARHQARLRAARVLLRVREAAERILEGAEEGVEAPFRQRFGGYLSALTGGRYSEAAPAAEDPLPAGVLRPDRRELPYALLSAGTRDLFALALRLSMAELFLGERRGFLMMDDPLVDLDPERQKLAAGVLAGFASRRQLLLFTCQPAHAVLLGEAECEAEGEAVPGEMAMRRVQLPGLGTGPGQAALKGKAARSRRR